MAKETQTPQTEDNSLQFGPQDIINKMRGWSTLEASEKTKYSAIEGHAILSPIQGIYNELTVLRMSNEAREEKLKTTLNGLEQTALLMGESAKKVRDTMVEEFNEEELNSAATIYHKSLNDFINLLNNSKNILPNTVTWGDQTRTNIAPDLYASTKLMNYAVNRLFSPNFKKENFLMDAHSFFMDLEEILKSTKIGLIYSGFEPIITSHDYVSYAIMPLVWNAKEHAFNPHNDIHQRTANTKFHKSMAVSGKPQQEDLEKGDYVVTVLDWGFGIRPEILERLFEKGASSKNGDGHGIGLWGVRDFIEKNGGKIDVQSELGKYTRFDFTIPYSRKEGYIYVQ